jgi:molybdopterin-guanine dinucleotide biosynthesis protein A
MGRDKAWLPIAGQSLVVRTIHTVQTVTRPVICLAGLRQSLPVMPPGTIVMRDDAEHRGPLTAMQAGFRLIKSSSDAVFVAATDLCYLSPVSIERLVNALNDHDAAVPYDGERHHPLCAVYRVSVLPQIESMLEAGDHRVMNLLKRIDVLDVGEDILGDPACVTNINTLEDYERMVRSL